MLGTGAVAVGEGAVGAAVVLRGGGVRHGEVADVQLLDLRVLHGDRLRLLQVRPAVRGEPAVGEVGDEALLRVRGEGDGVGVGDLVRDELADARRPHADRVAVRLAAPGGGRPGGGPHAARRVAAHAHRPSAEVEGDIPGGRRPHGQGDLVPLEHRPQLRLSSPRSVQIIQDALGLNARRRSERAVRQALREHDLAGQRLAYPVPVTGVHRERGVVLEVRVLRLLRVGERARVQPQPVAFTAQRAVLDGDPALPCVHQLGGGGRLGVGRAWQGDGVGVDPLGPGLLDVQIGCRAHRRQEIAGVARVQPHLVPVRGQVQRAVAGYVLLVALVEDVAQ